MSSLILRREGPVALVVLRRPPINALDREALAELGKAAEAVRADREARVVVITGGIDGIFCSGGDLKYWRQVHDGNEVSRIGREVFGRVERLPKPTIAAVNGHVIGDGLALALACDLRIASVTATFRLPEVAYGFIPGWDLIRRLLASVGRRNAAELLLTGQPVEASRARAMGFVNEVVPSDRLMDEVLKQARKLAGLSPAALRAAKCALRGGNERPCFGAIWNQKDWREGIDSVLSKRTPAYGPDGKGCEDCDHLG